VIVAGRRAERLAAARRLGADETYDVRGIPDLISTLKARTEGGRGADKVIEAVGSGSTWETAIAIARKAATVSLFGGCPAGTTVPLDTHRIHYDELTLRGTFHHTPQTIRAALKLICDGSVPAHEFVQGHAPLSELPRILDGYAHGTLHTIKTAILPPHS